MSLLPSLSRVLARGCVAAMCMALAGCIPARAPVLSGHAGSTATSVTVTSEELVPVRVYVVTPHGVRLPLGDVQPQATITLLMPSGILLPAEVRIVGVTAGRETRATELALVFPGDELIVTLRAPGHMSTLLRKR